MTPDQLNTVAVTIAVIVMIGVAVLLAHGTLI
jgi:hypothetical protein